jgi:hypothetical protein
MPSDNFLSKPPFYGGVTLQQGAYTVPHDFTDGGIATGFDFALDGFGHI